MAQCCQLCGSGEPVDFSDVFAAEREAIIERRRKLSRNDLEDAAVQKSLVGLAQSGGGVRSAAFCLGVLQALDVANVLEKVDYLSTVSGGGYAGSSFTAAMTALEKRAVDDAAKKAKAKRASQNEVENRRNEARKLDEKISFPFTSEFKEGEPPLLQHIRDNSNYLFPHGLSDVLSNGAIYLRGLAANALLVLPFLLIFAAITIIAHPVVDQEFSFIRNVTAIAVLGFAWLVAILGFVVWGLWRSLPCIASRPDFPSRVVRIATKVVGTLVLASFLIVQAYLLDATAAQGEDGFLGSFMGAMQAAFAWLAPVATAVSFAANKLQAIAKNADKAETKTGRFVGLVAQLLIFAAALVLPVCLWLLYLQLSYWGLCTGACGNTFAPSWLADLAHPVAVYFPYWVPDLAALYIAVAGLALFFGYWLNPNANSLHPLYRDRLSAAFLADPTQSGSEKSFRSKLSELTTLNAPYHLINAALNVQNSEIANKRGRNADFFIFSPKFVGSVTTKYVCSRSMERFEKRLDVGTAMATSGAAASSNMGAITIKALSPTLALLNIRLGYWMPNPKRLSNFGLKDRLLDFYFAYEMFGILNESRPSIYLTDGGHLENLGVYELLRRGCKVIIAVDAEEDGNYSFSSFNILQRYARIDLGVRIDLPWQPVANVSNVTNDAIGAKAADAKKQPGPHVAVGEIIYPDNARGTIVYIKASLTGDENDFVYDYKRRYPDFPHETTIDQLFSEEQFEAYRALGFHAAHGFFDRRDDFARRKVGDYPSVRKDLEELDALFPLAEGSDKNWPRKKSKFVDFLP